MTERTAAGNKGNRWGKIMMRLVFAAIVAADLAAIMIYPAERPTFAARWSAVESINAGVKGDRLDRMPPQKPLQWQPVPTMRPKATVPANYLANPRLGTRIACTSFCEFP